MVVGCNLIETDPTENSNGLPDSGTVEFVFNYYITGVPKDRVKRAYLRFAYTSDSLFKGLFFTSTNVSDAVSKYRVQFAPGVYYYEGAVVCLCAGDSCKYAGFSGQNGIRASGGKFQVVKDQVTEVSIQLH